MVRTSSRLVVSLLCAIVLVVTGALAAAAHVVLRPGSATQGAFTKLTFHVPNEQDTSSTVKVKVVFPDARAELIPAAVAQTKTGWKIKINKVRLDEPVIVEGHEIWEVVRSITWTAVAGTAKIGPDQFDEVSVYGGPLPSVGKIYFKAYQYQSDGQVVAWDQIPSDSDPHPAHPAPALTLTPPSGGTAQKSGMVGAGFAGDTAVRLTAAAENTPAERDESPSMLAASLSVAILLAGGMGVGLLAGRRRWARTRGNDA
ncbi:YcnI family protein [Actinomadura sp. NAK00032]|uniref:YcnI family copper-binding membrane protein n=1 Tax=Actinomadura sp. NAK00032 TaxID=2742128 RepID=UPI001590A9C1|nr:YcnI family protein [Actinomadura sp. NAK00032]QKW37591.1 YcnI family protein [Actinomadura sp. NAK00032]